MRLILAVVVVVLSVAQRAEACSCRDDAFAFLDVEGKVPVNARLPVLSPFLPNSEFQLVDTSSGAAVPASATVVPGGFLVVPDGRLKANTDFSLILFDGSKGFRTSELVDEVAPATPTLGAFTHNVSPALGRGGCDLGGDGFLIAVNQVEPGTRFEVFTGPSADEVDVTQVAWMLPATGMMYIGDASLCDRNLATSKTGNLAIRVRAVDPAGNASELSDALQLKSGCSAVGGSTFMLAALVALLRRKLTRSRR